MSESAVKMIQFQVPVSLAREIKMATASRGITIKQWYTELTEAALAKDAGRAEQDQTSA